MAVKVTLRQKPISNNRASLFLDFYPAIIIPRTGQLTRRQFLGSYVHTPIKFLKRKDKQIPVYDLNPTINAIYEEHNLEAIKIAEHIRQQRQNTLDKPEIYNDFEKERLRIVELSERSFITYFKELSDKRKASNHDNWVSAYHHLNKFTDGVLRFADLNEKFCDEFKNFLLTTKSRKDKNARLSKNSAGSYFNKFKSALKQAFKDGFLQIDLNAKVECIEVVETIKQTLTIEELNSLANTECKNPLLKKAVLFSALTGMPFKEMQNLNWGQIESSETFGIRIKMIRQKTEKPYYINISEQAFSILDKRKEPTEKVFEDLNNRDRYYYFNIWLAESGIKKEMTFHDLRHTYGCLQIELGTDIYTLQGNMGHSTPRQTMLYGKVSDQRKREAANKIKLNFNHCI